MLPNSSWEGKFSPFAQEEEQSQTEQSPELETTANMRTNYS